MGVNEHKRLSYIITLGHKLKWRNIPFIAVLLRENLEETKEIIRGRKWTDNTMVKIQTSDQIPRT